MKGIPIRFLFLALSLEALFLLLFLSARADRTVTAIIILLLAGAAYLIAAYLILKWQTNEKGPLFAFIISAAIIYRITLAPLMFPTTDDVFRYRWEGKLQAHGGNPYEARPADPEWAFLVDRTFPRVGLKEFKGGYGPAWEMVSHGMYRIAAAVSDNEFSQALLFKLPAVLADLGLIAALSALLRANGNPATGVLIYAWSPLPVWEFWANGHNDSLVALAVVLTLIFLARGQHWRASSALGLATALKFWPAILLPALIRRVHPRHLSIYAALLLLFAIPYWTGVTENAQFMSGFVGGWRNNDSIFGLILWIADDPYRAKYFSFALIGAITLLIAFRNRDPVATSMWTIVSLLFISSNCHPWYLTWFLPLLAVRPSAPLLLWTAIVPLAYSVWPGWIATGIWEGNPSTRWFIYAPVFAMLLGRPMWDSYASILRTTWPLTSVSRKSRPM
jgi:alpha-1,6-mannosyltransferase